MHDLIMVIYGRRMFPQCFPVSHTGNIVFSVSFSFPRCKLCLRYTAGNFSESEHASTSKQVLIWFLRAIRAKAKFCEQFQFSVSFDTPTLNSSLSDGEYLTPICFPSEVNKETWNISPSFGGIRGHKNVWRGRNKNARNRRRSINCIIVFSSS